MAFLSSKARRNALHDDVSRLLDSSYNTLNRYSAVVKDSHGDFHDPDYRPFIPITPPRSVSPRRVSSPRPYWETISMTEDDQTNDDEDDEDACDERRLSDGYAYSSRYAYRRSSGQYRRDTRYSYPHSYAHSYTPSYTTYSYTPSTLAECSPPTSYDSEATFLDEEPFGEKEKQGWTGVLRRKRKERGKEKEEVREEDEPECTPSSPVPSSVYPPVATKEEYVPTCGEVFQRHWQTLCLAFNLSVFRAQRRMKHRVHSLMSTH
ncbi:hypothetical protein AN958_00722 [Leucoagaricus sp. SymC.cos]|nr:hypothetical protein AN958_00722 [Leucoagaricus sp. SymC.cos]